MIKMGFDIDVQRLPDGLFKKFVLNCQKRDIQKSFSGVVINGLPFQFNFDYTRIGTTFSGGADSTLVLFILCKIIGELKLKTQIYPISIISHWKYGDFKVTAREKIIEFIDSKYPGIIQPISYSFLPDAFYETPIENLNFTKDEKEYVSREQPIKTDCFYLQMFQAWVSRRYSLQALYHGVTINPPSAKDPEENRKHLLHREPHIVDLDTLNFHEGQYEHIYGVFTAGHAPFEKIDKSWIMAQYYNLGITELLDLTKSCEELSEGCSYCFHCAERKWGIENRSPYLKKNMEFIKDSKSSGFFSRIGLHL